MRRKFGTKIKPWGWIFWILKSSNQDLSYEGSHSILSLLEVGHLVAQTQPFLTNYMKVQILASYNNLRIRQDSELAKF